jgi:hypothetical protein
LIFLLFCFALPQLFVAQHPPGLDGDFLDIFRRFFPNNLADPTALKLTKGKIDIQGRLPNFACPPIQGEGTPPTCRRIPECAKNVHPSPSRG